jgi:Protein of unknown function (DUF3887)
VKRWMVVVALLISACGVAAQTRFGYAMADAPYSEAKDFITLLASGNFGRAAQMVAADCQVDYPAEGLEASWMALLEKYGRFQAQEVSGADLSGDRWTIHVVCTFDRGRVDVALGFSSTTNQGRVTGVSYSRLRENERL